MWKKKHLKIALEIGDRAGEGRAYGILSYACLSQGDYRKASEYSKNHLKIALEVDDRTTEKIAYGNFGNTCMS